MSIEKKKYESYVRVYEKEGMPGDVELYASAQKERENFLDKFPVNRIKELSLEEYAFTKSSYGNKESFCSIMYYGMEHIAHRGNAYPHMFGIYIKNGSQIELSDTYKKQFGNDYEEAFLQINEDIVELLTEVGRDNLGVVKSCRLRSDFRYRLLIVYFPDKFLPICTTTMMKPVCKTMGVPFDNREMVYCNIELRKIKESSLLTRNWNNAIFLGFCRWVGDVYSVSAKRKIDVSYAEEIDAEVDRIQLQGEEREAVVKVRVNQGAFREELLKRYEKCVLCGIKKKELLIASHIKPWKDSEPEEKVDVDNGFLFCPNHDKLFDNGLISFSDRGEIIISESLDEENRTYANVRQGMTIGLTEGNRKYLLFHRNEVFEQ